LLWGPAAEAAGENVFDYGNGPRDFAEHSRNAQY